VLSEHEGVAPAPVPPAPELWLGVAAVAGGHLAVDVCMGIWPVHKVLAGLDLPTAGWIATFATVAGNGLQLGFGALADRGWRRALIALGVAGAGVVCFLPYASRAPELLGLMLVASAGSAAFHPAGGGYAGGASTRRAGLAVALFLVGGYLGFAVSQLAYAAAFRALEGRLAPLYLLPLALGLAFALVRGRPASAGAVRAPEAERTLAWGRVAALFAIQGLSAAAGMTVMFLLPEIFGARGAPPLLAQGGAHCLMILAACAALLPAGAAHDRFGARAVLFSANLLSAVALEALALGAVRSSGGVLLLVLVFGAANAANTVVALAEGTRLLARRRSTIAALLTGAPWFLAAPAPAIAALLADTGRGGTPDLALAWTGLCLPVACGVALLLPRQGRPDGPPDHAVGSAGG
jgi:MFS family permease